MDFILSLDNILCCFISSGASYTHTHTQEKELMMITFIIYKLKMVLVLHITSILLFKVKMITGLSDMTSRRI